MKAFLVSDNHDSLVLLNLAGIRGTIAREPAEVRLAVDDILKNRRDVGVLVVTERIAEMVPDLVKGLRERGEPPLLVEIPDRHGSRRGADFLTGYIRSAIGVNIE